MRAEDVEAIPLALLPRMTREAPFYLFTYGRRCSVPDSVLERLGLTADHVGMAWRNMPPARMLRLLRRIDGQVAV